ncbi:hypothetical protein ACHAPS_004378 [Verticillium nonalfalfae]
MELKLVKLWAQVLDLDDSQIGKQDNFFRMGGHSILAMKLVGAARKAGLKLTVALIFQYPRLANLATVAETIGEDDTEDKPTVVPPFSLLPDIIDPFLLREQVGDICGVGSDSVLDVYPCTPLQEGMLALSVVQTGNYVLQSVLEISSAVGERRIRNAWEKTVDALPILRTRIAQHSTLGLIQVVLDEGVMWQVGDDLEEYLRMDKETVMNLGGPLGRTGTTFFAVTIHHALYDGVSWQLIREHFANAYNDQAISGVDFKHAVKTMLDMDGSTAGDYWQQYFSGFSGATFPSIQPGVEDVAADTTIHSNSFVLPIDRGFKSSVTLACLVRAAWALVVSQYTGDDDIVFGCLLSGRNMAVPDAEKIVGPTIATVPFRSQPSSNKYRPWQP